MGTHCVMEDWDSNEWQGRSRDQVEFYYKITAFCYITIFIIILFL
jgi:hypothetical protein